MSAPNPEALVALVAACEEAFCSEMTEVLEGDDDDVSIPPTGITFGMIRRARAALAASKADAATRPRPHRFDADGKCMDCGDQDWMGDRPCAGSVAEREAGWRPMETAPRDGTLVRLLVDFDDHPTDDSDGHAPTIGANSFDHTGEDRWQFAGWDWSHDLFTEGEGTPVGWLPMLDKPAAGAVPGAADYTPGTLDFTAPPRIWLQIDTTGNNDARDEPWPGSEHVTWQDESIGGLEIQYVRADLSAPDAAGAVPEEVRGAVDEWNECQSPLEAQRAMFKISNALTLAAATQESPA